MYNIPHNNVNFIEVNYRNLDMFKKKWKGKLTNCELIY